MDKDSVIPPGSSDGDLPARLLAMMKLSIPGYRLLEEISRGGQAIVYRAIQNRTGRTVAVKVLKEGSLAGEEARQRLQRELSILASVDHPNVVNVIDFGQTAQGHDYLVMNYIVGKPLGDLMAEEFKKGASNALLLSFVKICRAVHAVHLKGIAHRDISPSNILVDERNEPHLLDFGLARTAFDRLISRDGTEISSTGQFLGKLAYASPEHIRGKPNAMEHRSDIYSLGVILYQMISGGRFPYNVEAEPARVLEAIANQKPAPLNCSVPGIDSVAFKALEKEPAHRYQTALELARDVENGLDGKVDNASKPGRKGRLAALIAVAVLTVLIAGVAWHNLRPIDHEADAGSAKGELPRPLVPSSPATARHVDLIKLVGSRLRQLRDSGT
jgi:serine/threonine protein kinase